MSVLYQLRGWKPPEQRADEALALCRELFDQERHEKLVRDAIVALRAEQFKAELRLQQMRVALSEAMKEINIAVASS